MRMKWSAGTGFLVMAIVPSVVKSTLFCAALGLFTAEALAAETLGSPKADNRSSDIQLELLPNYHSLSVSVFFRGDVNHNSSANFEYRLDGSTQWRPGPTLVRIEPHDVDGKRSAWRASLYPFEPGTAMRVRVTLTDPDNPRSFKIEDTVTLFTFSTSTPGTSYYVSPDGSDEASGTELASAWKTLNHAVRVARPGDLVLVAPGIYRERIVLGDVQGAPEHPLVFRRLKSERPVIDNGIPIPRGSGGWRRHRGAIFRRDVAVPEDKPIRIVTVNGRRAMRYENLNGSGPTLENDGFELGRAYYEQCIDRRTRRLYLRLPSGSSPDNADVVVALVEHTGGKWPSWRDNAGVTFSGTSHVVLDGFEIRHSGGIGVSFYNNSSHNLITNCLIHHNNRDVVIRDGNHNAIWDNEIHQVGAGDFKWSSFYSAATAYATLFVPIELDGRYGGRGHSIVRNDIHEGWDLIQPDASDVEIFYNRLWNSSDDAIELDGNGVNIRVHRNDFRNVFAMISIAPMRVGPTYITRNTATFHNSFLKMGSGYHDHDGYTFAYNNSCYVLSDRGGMGFGNVSWTVNGKDVAFGNKVFLNNALYTASRKCVRLRPPIELDYNAYDYPSENNACFRWHSKPESRSEFYTIDGFRQLVGKETHGFTARGMGASDLGWLGKRWMNGFSSVESHYKDFVISSYPAYEQPWKGVDFHVREDSVLIDRGVAIPGFNGDSLGKAPDIGAHERGR